MNGEMPSKPIPEPSAKVPRRMWSKIKQEGGCWIWTGATNWEYGSTSIDTGDFRAHRLFFQWFKYDIPKGLTIDHLGTEGRTMKLNILMHVPEEGEDGETLIAIDPKEGETVEELAKRVLVYRGNPMYHQHLQIRIVRE